MNIPTDDLNLAIGSRTQYALGRALERMGFRAAAQEAYLSSLMLDSRHRAAWNRLRQTRECTDTRVEAPARATVTPMVEMNASVEPRAAVRVF